MIFYAKIKTQKKSIKSIPADMHYVSFIVFSKDHRLIGKNLPKR